MAKTTRGRRQMEKIPSEVTALRLSTFLLVAQHQGLSGAAGARNPDLQSRMSRILTQLETAVGVDLFERRGRGRDLKRLTSAGEKLRAITQALEDFHQEAKDSGGRPKAPLPELTLRAHDGVLRWMVLPALASFDAGQAGFRLRVEASATPLEDVAAGRCDLAVGLPDGTPGAGVKTSPLAEWGMAAFVPLQQERAAVWDLRRWQWVEVQGLPRSPLDALEAEVGLGLIVRAGIACETFAQAARLVAERRFAAVLPAAARTELGGLAEVLPGRLAASGRGQRLHLQARKGAVSNRRRMKDAFEWLEGALRRPLHPASPPR